MATIARLVVELGMDDKSFKSGIDGSAQSLDKWGKGMMKAGGIITGALAVPITLGSKAAWDQVDAVEQATVAMNAYADSTDQVDAVLGQLLDYARSDMGVLFSRQELFSAAQSMLMYGASIDHVADYTEILSRSVGLGLSNWDDLNRVIGRVGSTGRLTGNDFDYLKAAGFDLDDSLRNTNMTWEELMMHLDAGIPADALAGQADTIRGKTIRLQSALRGLGLAFLGVDSETSKFIEGGLGDTMFKGMSQLTELMKQAAPAVQQFGIWMADLAVKASGVVDWFLALPQPLKDALLLFTGISGVALMLGGAFLLVSAKVMAFMKVVSAMGGLTGIVKGLGVALRAVTLTNPLFWLLTAAIAAFIAYKNNFMGFADAVKSFGTSSRRALQQVTRALDRGRMIVQRFGKVWSSAFDAFKSNGTNPVSAGFMAIRMALYDVSMLMGPFGGVIRSIGDAFGGVRHIVDDVIASFQYFRSAASSLVAAVVALFQGEWGKAFSSLKDAATDGMTGMLTALDTVLDAFGQAGGWIIDQLGDLGSRLWGWMSDQVRAVDWASAFDAGTSALASAGSWVAGKLGDLVTGVWNWVSGAVAGVNWQAAFDASTSALVSAGSWVAGKLGDAWAAISTWFLDQVSRVPWEAMFNAGIGALADAGAWIVGKLGDAWTGISTWFIDQVSRVPWEALAKAGLDTLSSFGSWIVDKMESAIDSIQTWFRNQFDGVAWAEVAQGAIDYLATAIGNAVSSMASITSKVLAWMTTQVTGVSWSSVGEKFGELLGIALKAAIGVIALAAKLFLQLMIELGKVDWATLASALWGLLKAAALAAIDLLVGIAEGLYNELLADITGVTWDDLWEPIFAPFYWAIDTAIDAWNGFMNLIGRGSDDSAIGSASDSLGNLIRGEAYHQTVAPPERTPWSRKSDEFGLAERPTNVPALVGGNSIGQMFRDAALGSDMFTASLANLTRATITSDASLNATASTVPMFGGAVSATADQTEGAGQRIGNTFGTIALGVAARSAEARNAATANFAGMQSSTMASALGMQTGVAARMSALQSSVSTQSTAARTAATTQFSSMQTATAGHMLGMRTSAALQMGLMSSTATTEGRATMSNMAGSLVGGMFAVSAAMLRVPAAVLSAGNSAADLAYSAGANISRGFASGMLAYLGVIQSAANAMVAAAVQAVIAKAMISSPSRLFEHLGSQIGEGFEEGILGSVPAVQRASERMVHTGIPSMNTPRGGFNSGGTTVIDNTTHNETYVALNDAQFAELLAAKDKANIVHAAMTDRNAASQYRKAGG